MSVSEWLPLNMQSGEKHVRPAVGLRRQIASGSVIRWSLEGPNWIMDSEVSVCASSCVCLFDETARAMLGGRTLWPPYLGPSVSIRQHDRHSPLCHDPSPLGHRCPHVYSITVHYLVSAWRHRLRKQRRGRGRWGRFWHKNPDPISIKILPLSRFLEVITGLPKLYWEK